jgi:hypothetical protein
MREEPQWSTTVHESTFGWSVLYDVVHQVLIILVLVAIRSEEKEKTEFSGQEDFVHRAIQREDNLSLFSRGQALCLHGSRQQHQLQQGERQRQQQQQQQQQQPSRGGPLR